jgi:hypothetical protein
MGSPWRVTVCTCSVEVKVCDKWKRGQGFIATPKATMRL